MIIDPPEVQEVQDLLGELLYLLWEKLLVTIESRYVLDRVWHAGGRKWLYEVKFRKGSKTICSLLVRDEVLGFLVIFGKLEQELFEARCREFSPVIIEGYDAAMGSYDGKWLLFDASEEALFLDFMKLLLIKRKPDRLTMVNH